MLYAAAGGSPLSAFKLFNKSFVSMTNYDGNSEVINYKPTVVNFGKTVDVVNFSGEDPYINKVFVDRDALIADKTSSTGTLATVASEPGNFYQRLNDKWVIMTGNKYTTANTPTDTDVFTFPVGLEIFDITLGHERTWTIQE